MNRTTYHKHLNKLNLILKTLTVLIVLLMVYSCRKSSASKSNFIEAIKKGEHDRIEDLIEVGEDVNQLDYSSDDTPLILAIGNRDKKMVEILLDASADVNKKGKDCAPIHSVSYRCQIEIMKLLIEAKANLDDTTLWNNSTPLEISLHNNNLDCAKLLIKNGASIDKLPTSKFISHIASRGYLETLKYLLDELRIPFTNEESRLALIYSTRAGEIWTLQYLLKKNNDVNFLDDYGDAPLHIAAQIGNVSILNLLINANADLNLKNRHGETALDIAIKKKNFAMADILKNSRAAE
ncbi:ankyrin repeat domain-containing protein [Leptospira kanakyensis]|uniref:ankyrin repeat domain-containing protein n=1 Tax=Leptospira kanakyensis TaxID=2484968 RepID=UPI00223E3E02|nr:ankyrin repeat domain-containing protein [Leptospira kanakyensis]MCW7483282.1 ankyrin repeat domain-containing protein [Leptospira kanakyensis]